MKTHLFTLMTASLFAADPLLAHGPGHIHGAREVQAEVNEALGLVDAAPAGQERNLPKTQGGAAACPVLRDEAPMGAAASGAGNQNTGDTSSSGKSLKAPVAGERPTRWWGASLEAGWEGRHVHYGVDETGNFGAYTTEVSVWIGDLSLSAWNGFGLGNAFEEWDITAAYNIDLGPVFFIPGYNFRYSPGLVEEEHSEDHADHHEEEQAGEEHGHDHKEYGHELFIVLGTNAIRYVTPSAAFIWDLNNTPGAFLELRLDGDIPVYKDVISIQPYTLLGLNLGYNTRSYYGWNNWQFGVEATWQVARHIEVFGGINYSVAMTALRDIGQDNVVWANAGARLNY